MDRVLDRLGEEFQHPQHIFRYRLLPIFLHMCMCMCMF